MKLITAMALILILATSVFALDKTIYQMRQDFGSDALYDCSVGYYYYVPCPTYSYFWSFSGWEYGDCLGEFFVVGDARMGTGEVCDPYNCHEFEALTYLDFNANAPGQYPEDFQIEFCLYCSDLNGCAVGPALWCSGMVFSLARGWNWVYADPPICLTQCVIDPPGGPVFLVQATHYGTFPDAPNWGTDGPGIYFYYCASMHETGCLQAIYPRPWTSYYTPGIHSAYYGNPCEPCPVAYFCDGMDTTPDCSQFGFCELAWTARLACRGPTATEPTTWGNIKSMYK